MNFKPIKVVDVELSASPQDFEGLHGYAALRALVRLHGVPVGSVQLALSNGRCLAADIVKEVSARLAPAISRHMLDDWLAQAPRGAQLSQMIEAEHPDYAGPFPLVTVAVCTRDRAANLPLCLNALLQLDYPALEILIVDNAPSNDATKRLIHDQFPAVRYVCEPRPGLDWARNRAIAEAQGTIIAYTDDDVIVDRGWARAFVPLFVENPEVMAVTGLVVPYELETEAQALFEQYGGFGRGYQRKWFRLSVGSLRKDQHYIGAGAFGTGANMIYRRSVFSQIGMFDPALDVGTATNGGGDLEMFFRVLKLGHTLVYEPAAFVRHCHRPDYGALRVQLANNGIGFFSYLVRSAWAYPDERFNIVKLGVWWLWWWNFRRLLLSFVYPMRFPRDLIVAELRGSFIGLGRYRKAKRALATIEQQFGPAAQIERVANSAQKLAPKPTAIHSIDLGEAIRAVPDVGAYRTLRVFVRWNDRLLGMVEIEHDRQVIGAARLRQAVVERLMPKLIEPDDAPAQPDNAPRQALLEARVMKAFAERHLHATQSANRAPPAPLADDIAVSIVVATRDRPHDLRACLDGLTLQATRRHVEIIVVDNNPGSSLTRQVVQDFPGVRLLSEPRRGLSYARNTGFAASTGAIVIATDDDVVVPPEWLEKLIAPFMYSHVMAVTGNVLPFELETKAQQAFETYGGLGRGFEYHEFTSAWFEHFKRSAVPTWTIGATANAAFRADIFSHPQIGMLDEALGAGTPTGCSEDTDLFYKVLKAGYSIVYEPNAFLWHKHRRDMKSLRAQIYSYSKGHVAYHLTTLLRDHDLRALHRLAAELPRAYLWKLKQWAKRSSAYPFDLIALEIAGSLAGPLALWRSRRMVRQIGSSEPYHPVAQRHSVVSDS